MRTSLALGAFLGALYFSPIVAIADTPTTCSLATMRGTMAFAGTGEKGGVPYSVSGMESYDGQGHLKYYELYSDGVTQHKWIGTGTYTITTNCIATVIYDGDVADAWTFFVAPDCSIFYYNNNLGYGNVSGGHEERISKALLIP
jgi:hypothetical protein